MTVQREAPGENRIPPDDEKLADDRYFVLGTITRAQAMSQVFDKIIDEVHRHWFENDGQTAYCGCGEWNYIGFGDDLPLVSDMYDNHIATCIAEEMVTPTAEREMKKAKALEELMGEPPGTFTEPLLKRNELIDGPLHP